MKASPLKPRTRLITAVLWMAVLAAAFMLDRPVAQVLQDSRFPGQLKDSLLADILKAPGHFWFTIAVAVIVAIFHAWGWRAGALVCLAAIVSGMNGLVKWIAGRVRPFKMPDRAGELLPLDFHPFIGGITGLWSTKNLCFPSGHAALAFATAQMLAMLLPRWRWWFYAGASLVGLERILENAHYVSDVVAAALLGIYGAKLVWWTCERLMAALQPLGAQGSRAAGGDPASRSAPFPSPGAPGEVG